MAASHHSCPIIKINAKKRVVKGPVLIPDIYDQQGTMISADVIEDSAHEFLSSLTGAKATKSAVGVMHTDFSRDIELVEWYVLDQPLQYEVNIAAEDVTKYQESFRVPLTVDEATQKVSGTLPTGTLMAGVKVNDDDTWKNIEKGVYKGFSIGGDAWKKYDEEAA